MSDWYWNAMTNQYSCEMCNKFSRIACKCQHHLMQWTISNNNVFSVTTTTWTWSSIGPIYDIFSHIDYHIDTVHEYIFVFYWFCTQLNAHLNPGCPPTICNGDDDNWNETQTVIHIKADGEHDTLHYIWDFRKQPSVLVALTESNTTMNIKWEQFVNDAPSVLEFSNKPKYTMSFVLSKVSVRCTNGRRCACVTQVFRKQVTPKLHTIYWWN